MLVAVAAAWLAWPFAFAFRPANLVRSFNGGNIEGTDQLFENLCLMFAYALLHVRVGTGFAD